MLRSVSYQGRSFNPVLARSLNQIVSWGEVSIPGALLRYFPVPTVSIYRLRFISSNLCTRQPKPTSHYNDPGFHLLVISFCPVISRKFASVHEAKSVLQYFNYTLFFFENTHSYKRSKISRFCYISPTIEKHINFLYKQLYSTDQQKFRQIIKD